MIDDLRSDDGLSGFDGHFHDRAQRRPQEERPLADREVPLGKITILRIKEARIMDALPQTAPVVITPWYRREFVVTPKFAVTVASALVVAAAAVTITIMVIAR